MDLAAKIFVSFELRISDIRESMQSIELQGLTREMLWNKELARHFREPGPRAGANSRKVPARIFSILLSAFSAVKVARHKKWILCCGKEEREHYRGGCLKAPPKQSLDGAPSDVQPGPAPANEFQPELPSGAEAHSPYSNHAARLQVVPFPVYIPARPTKQDDRKTVKNRLMLLDFVRRPCFDLIL
jgi:hypothetical protein